jgi:pimeloyl-ACP methyl ester carboxylesterase
VTDTLTTDTAEHAESSAAIATGRRRRGVTVLGWALGTLGALLLFGVVGMVVWSQVGVMAAEPQPLRTVTANPAIAVTDEGAAIVLAPTATATGDGLVFYPGAKVEPSAYEAKLAGIVEDGTTVVIVRPWLNLALFDLRPLSTFTELAPEVDTWAVGGHSMGGVRACIVSADAEGLVLFGAYCGSDVSESETPALSISGSEDGLSTPEKIDQSRRLLPDDAVLVEIAGAGHSSFGDYGLQPGDGTPSISDDDMTAQVTEVVSTFFG